MSSEISRLAPKAGADESPQPWWRYRMLWLVVGGPLVVVVASIITAVIAIRGADPVLTPTEMAASVKSAPQSGAMAPAVQARNHAAAPKP
ncbi:MAG: nitrogen fixation protein FixH [Ideonella sp. MAG2]|nr:MAG: nitrogen fixation protein FixH [Ideonella sp. MAG2]